MDDNATPKAPVAKKTRTSRGRQCIEIKKLEVESKRQVTFSKRRKGLFKKAEELSTLCGAEVGILTISKSGRVFGTDNINAVVDRYRPESSSDHHGNDGSLKKKKGVEEQQRIDNAGFWLDQPIEKLSTEKLVEYVAVLNDLREKAAFRLEEISIQDSSSLWSLVADQQVTKDEFVNQFNFMGENENIMAVFNYSTQLQHT